MRPWEKYSFAALTAILAVTGVVYFWMKFMMATDDPFAVVNHPLQPLMLQLHLLAAPAFLLIFGIIFNSHVGRKIGKKIPNRKSGLLSLVTLAVMTVSGYLLQVVTAENVRQITLVAHIASGLVFSGAYLTHLAISVRMVARERRVSRNSVAA
jgi:hypothetical protein